MPEVELSAGTMEYEDTGGPGPVLVLTHGVAMNETLWRDVVADLRTDHRCVVPVLPLGAHRRAMKPGADLSMHGIARLLAELLEQLDLRDVTLAINDWGGPQLLVSDGLDERIARLVITSCEAFDNVPPGLPGRVLGIAASIPGGLNAMVQPLRFRPIGRLPIAFGWMAKRPVPRDVMDSWAGPLLSRRSSRKDLIKYVRTTEGDELVAAAEALGRFDRPALVAWAADDRVMPPEHGRRLAELLPQGRLVEIPDSYTLIPLDQPGALAGAIREFVQETAAERVTT
jgi:pimeloyl-ACP methyl ester carboxylesterase